MTKGGISAIIVIWMIYMCIPEAFGAKAIKGKRPKYGPWSACDQVCGHNGKQTRRLYCYDKKGCAGQRQEDRDCNSVNCPQPCSFDGILLQLLHSLNLNISVNNNHLVAAFSEVMEAMSDTESQPSSSDVTNDFLIKKIKYFLQSTDNSSGQSKHARTFLGILLARQKTCDYTDISRELRDEIGDEGFKKLLNVDGKVTLIFVIDISGSMRKEIPQATEIVKDIAEYTSIANVDYVLSTFSSKSGSKDFVGDVQNFDDRKEFINALDRLVKREHRREKKADCQEPTYTGIIRAITNGHPQRGSPMYVFTDAPPYALGDFTPDNAIYHAQTNKIPVNVFLSKPFCGPQTKSSYRVIAEATGGLILPLRKGSSMKHLEQMIMGSLDGTAIVASNRNNRKRGTKKYDKTFFIDDIAHEGTLEVEVKDAEAVLLNPGKSRRNSDIKNGVKLLWTIKRPARGTWRLRSKAADLKFRVKSQTKLGITLDCHFMRSATHIDDPLIGEKAKVKIKVPSISRLNKNSLSLPNDWILLSQNNDIYTYESKDPLSEEHFKISMRGKTLSGFDFTRESRVIQPKIAVIKSLMEKQKYFPEAGKKFQYRASIGYAKDLPMSFQMKFIADFGDNDEIINPNYTDITLSRGVKTVSWTLTAPTKGYFTMKIRLKRDDVEINFQDDLFFVKG